MTKLNDAVPQIVPIGLARSISSIFHARLHFFIAFSRAIAS